VAGGLEEYRGIQVRQYVRIQTVDDVSINRQPSGIFFTKMGRFLAVLALTCGAAVNAAPLSSALPKIPSGSAGNRFAETLGSEN
jgi:hypothetical protein